MFFSQFFAGNGALSGSLSGSRTGNGNPTEAGWFALSGGYGVGQSEAGTFITPATALAQTAVQRAVTLIAESVAQLPCRLYQRQQGPNGETSKMVTDHPVYDLIAVRPNGWMTPFQATEYKQHCMGLRGNAYSLKDIAADGSILSLYPLHPDRVQVLVSPVDRMPYYRVLLAPDGISGTFSLGQMHHVRWIGDNPYVGLSPIALHKEALGIAAAAERHTAKVFGNGTRLSGVITRPKESVAIKEQTAIDKITGDWKKKYGGSENAGEVAFLQEGMDFKPLSMSNADAQLLEARGYGVRDIARIYGLPARMLGLAANGVKSSFEQEAMEFVIYCLLPWIKRHEECMERDLLTDTDIRAGLFIQFDFTALLRVDTESRYASYAMARQWGWLSVNDIRRLENLPPIAGGDAYLTPLNMTDGKQGSPIAEVRAKRAGKNGQPADEPSTEALQAITEVLQR